jgi:hypothetical protein
MALSDLLNQAGSGGPNPLAFLAQLGQPQPPPAPPQTGVPQAAPIDPTGATVLPAAAPGNVLARLQSGSAPTPPAITTPHLFSGVPDVKGMSRGAAFASGLSGGLGDASKQALLAQQAQSQNFQNNLELYKTLWGQKNTEASQAETAKRDQALQSMWAAQSDPELQGKLAKAKAENAEPDEVANAAERGKILAAIDAAHGNPEGTFLKTPEGSQFYAEGKFPTKAQSSAAGSLNKTEEDAVIKGQTKIDALSNSLDTLKQARGVIANGDIYSGYTGDVAQWIANKLPGNVSSAMQVDQDKAARTTAYNNAIQSAVLPQAKDNFGARVSNYEERIMQNLAPTSAVSPQARQQILDTIIHRREAALAGEYQTIDDIKSRKMFQPGYRAPNPYENWDPDKDLTPAGKTIPATAPAAPAPPQTPGNRAAAAPPPRVVGAGIVSPAAAATAQRVKVSTPADLAKLPSGTPFITDDGRTGTRQ